VYISHYIFLYEASEKATLLPLPVGIVVGLAYLVPKPDPTVQGYALTGNMVPALPATAIVSPAGEKETP
jgi:hypothetical protein